MPKDVQLNLANLLSIDEKLHALAECLKKNSTSQISQLCSDWWELSDEEQYAVAQFSKVFKDERAKRDLKQMITMEILSIATINYFTSSPEIFRPSSVQINQVRNLLNTMHLNLHSVIELILQRLPESMQNSQPSQKLSALVK